MKFKLKVLGIVALFAFLIVALVTVIFKDSLYANLILKRDNEGTRVATEEEERLATLKKVTNTGGDKIVTGTVYDIKNEYYNGLALVKKDGKWGYIDRNGSEKIPLIYDSANNFTLKVAKVKKDGNWGYIDLDGKETIPIEYYFCGDPVRVDQGAAYNYYVAVGKGGLYGFCDINGNKVCDLIYDRVEAFSSEGTAKVVKDKKYGYINTKGTVIVAIDTPSNEENIDFTGTWNRTNTQSSFAGVLEVSHQMATSFDFELTSKYYSISDKFEGTAEIVESNTAKYFYGFGTTQDTITFTIVDDKLEVTSILGGNLDMDSSNTIDGTYKREAAVYTNEGIIEELFNKEEILQRIRQTITEDLYENEFLYGFRNGIYTEEKLTGAAAIKGTVYHVYIPTTEKDFKLLVNDLYIYFYSKNEDVYKTDDPDRQNKIPSAIAYDEV